MRDPNRLKILAVTFSTLLSVSLYVTLLRAQDFVVGERVALPFPPGVTVQSQCGLVDDLQDVELYDGSLGVSRSYVDQNEESTIQLQWLGDDEIISRLPEYSPGNISGVRWCTGTLFSQKHVLTAGHCFDVNDGSLGWVSPFKLGPTGLPEYAPPEILATLQVVNFRYQIDGGSRSIRSAEVFPVVSLLEYREGNDRLDYAIIELGRNSSGKLPGEIYNPAVISKHIPQDGEKLAIIQHPQGQPKKIEAGHVLVHQGPNLYYNDIDTHGGSSGSGVRDTEGSVIAVHTNGGCQRDVENSANRGVSVVAITAVSSLF